MREKINKKIKKVINICCETMIKEKRWKKKRAKWMYTKLNSGKKKKIAPEKKRLIPLIRVSKTVKEKSKESVCLAQLHASL